MKRVEELGAKVVYPVSLPSYKELEVNGEWIPGTVNGTTFHHLYDFVLTIRQL